MSAIGPGLRLTPEQSEEHHQEIVKEGNEGLWILGEDVFVYPHEQALKVSYVKNGWVHLPEGTELPKGENEYDAFDRLFKEKLYPDEAFYEVLLTRLYPDENKIDSREKLARDYQQSDVTAWPLPEAVRQFAQILDLGNIQMAAHIIYQLPAIVHEKSEDGATLLCLVAASKKISDVATHRLMQILIDSGAKTCAKGFFDGKEVTPLYLACTNKKQWSARLLMRYQEAGSDELQEFGGDSVAIGTLLSAWGNSGRPECPQSNKIKEIRSRMNENRQEEIRRAIRELQAKETEREEKSPVQPGSLSSGPSSSISPSSSSGRLIKQMGVVQSDPPKKTSLVARLVIGAMVGGLFGWLMGLRRIGIVASSVIGSVLGAVLFRKKGSIVHR